MSQRKHWFRSALTDDNGEFDVGQILTPIVVFWILANSTIAVWINKQPFDAQQVGTGIAAVLGALGVYKWGDSRGKHEFPRERLQGDGRDCGDVRPDAR